MRSLVLGLGAVFLIWAAIHFVDDPVARFVHTLPWAESLRSPVLGVPVLVACAGVAILASAYWAETGHPLRKLQEVAIVASFSLASSVAFDEFVLKPVFGRPTPDEFLQNGIDKFHWFQGSLINSFPSGHAVQIVSVGVVFCAAYPRQRSFWLALMGVGLVALVLGNWHFVSDVLAGTGVGLIVGFATMIIWRSRGRGVAFAQDGNHRWDR